jgi:hypothetical protein
MLLRIGQDLLLLQLLYHPAPKDTIGAMLDLMPNMSYNSGGTLMTFPLAGKGNLRGLLNFPSAQTTVIVVIITHTHYKNACIQNTKTVVDVTRIYSEVKGLTLQFPGRITIQEVGSY